MPLFNRKSQESLWHQQIEARIAAQRFPDDVGEFSFPIEDLKKVTSQYLVKRKLESISTKCDEQLERLLEAQKFGDLVGRLSAFVSCLPFLSPSSARSLVVANIRLDGATTSHAELQLLLRFIVIAQEINGGSLREEELDYVSRLIKFASPQINFLGTLLKDHFAQEKTLTSKNALSTLNISHLVDGACKRFANHLLTLEQNGKLFLAYVESSWFSKIANDAEISRTLNNNISEWKSWTEWRPDTSRLKRWEKLTDDHIALLQDLLVLEGRDTTGSGKGTLLEALDSRRSRPSDSISCEAMVITPAGGDIRAELDNLFDGLDAALGIGPNAVLLFAHLCGQGQANARTVDIISAIEQAGVVATASKAVLDFFISISNNSKITYINKIKDTNKLVAIMRLLPVLGSNDRLRQLLSSVLSSEIGPALRAAQDTLATQIRKGGTGETVGMRIFSFGSLLTASEWLQPFFSTEIQIFAAGLPTEDKLLAVFKHRVAIREDGLIFEHEETSNFLMATLAGRGTSDQGAHDMALGLATVYQRPMDSDRRAITVFFTKASKDYNIDSTLVKQCLDELHEAQDWFTKGLASILIKRSDTLDLTCAQFMDLLMQLLQRDPHMHSECWRKLWLSMFEVHIPQILGLMAVKLSLSSWFQWTSNLHALIGTGNPFVASNIDLEVFFSWTGTLKSDHSLALGRLEKALNGRRDLRWIYLRETEIAVSLLHLLDSPTDAPLREVENVILSRLIPEGGNASAICAALSRLSKSSEVGIEACRAVVRRYDKSRQEISRAIFSGWLKDEGLSPSDRRTIESVGALLGVNSLNESEVIVAKAILVKEYEAVIKSANSFDSLRIALKLDDAPRTKVILAQLGIEDTSISGVTNLDVPPSLIHYIELVDDGIYELSFPIVQMRPFKRKALGVPTTSRMIIVRLNLRYGFSSPSFCVHLDHGMKPEDNAEHTFWRTSRSSGAPNRSFCGQPTSRFLYHASRALWKHLQEGVETLESAYNAMSKILEDLSHQCLVCGTSLGRLLRSSVCSGPCSFSLSQAALEVRLEDLKSDSPVVDALLAGIYAAAVLNRTDVTLLPGCPLGNSVIKAELGYFPPMSSFKDISSFATDVRALGQTAVDLLSWTCTTYRGFLTSATHGLRIPSMPNVHQFVLANAAPGLESAFATNFATYGSTVLFHGTSLDRLYCILREGLRVVSGTGLQQHGATSGHGIYLADEPSTSTGYFGSASSWRGSAYQNVGVLLACEYAGPPSRSIGIQVVTDPSMVIVRYVFLCPHGFVAPMRKDIVPAIEIACSSLRSGSV
ncbi:hypothetical protein NA57DRAFT_79545 [Rhizodiscina lignyota]|uniref:PARP catalytic domain-containing protein n=1 Tax=Rhizodiscina lignyota TaxID=1504668 RepID=A0A9P4IB56_9PEZI|nr:hypothetical protein NA57DRAFT_79545 [Rhizodiscina lignyota]